MAVRMTATRSFTNPRVTGPRPDGAVTPGDAFTTDWVHGKELRQLGLAEPDDEDAFDAEPVEMMQPHNQISEAELRRVNARRRQARGALDAAAGRGARPAVTGFELSRPAAETAPLETATDAGGTATGTGGTSDPGTPADAGAAAPVPPAPASGIKSNAPAIPPAPGAAA